jgi:hypothetical protein
VRAGRSLFAIFLMGKVPDLPGPSDIELTVIYEIQQRNLRLCDSRRKKWPSRLEKDIIEIHNFTPNPPRNGSIEIL